ncbi:MAG: hypothetical protein K2Q26_01260 [Bdellovibrionales bacterium]|nr:hypothetical protein [Bdellovibrionales bacterium]
MIRPLLGILILAVSFSTSAQTVVLVEKETRPMSGIVEGTQLINFEDFVTGTHDSRLMISVLRILKKKNLNLPTVMNKSKEAVDPQLAEGASGWSIGALSKALAGHYYKSPTTIAFRFWVGGESFECGARLSFQDPGFKVVKEAKIRCPNEIQQVLGINPVIEVQEQEHLQLM